MYSEISVSENVILTAAHCILDKKTTIEKIPNKCKIVVGTYNLKNGHGDDKINFLPIERFVLNKAWSTYTKNYDADIGLIILKDALKFDHNIRPVCLPSKKEDYSDLVGDTGVVAGWGLKNEEKNSSGIPKIVEMRIISAISCMAEDNTYEAVLTHRTFCSAPTYGQGPCQGKDPVPFDRIFLSKLNGQSVF